MKHFDDTAFLIATFVGLGAIIGAGITLWEKGREYGMREMLKKMEEKDNGKI